MVFTYCYNYYHLHFKSAREEPISLINQNHDLREACYIFYRPRVCYRKVTGRHVPIYTSQYLLFIKINV